MKIYITIGEDWVRLTCDELPNRVITADFMLTENEERLSVLNLKELKRRDATHKVLEQLFKELGERNESSQS